MRESAFLFGVSNTSNLCVFTLMRNKIMRKIALILILICILSFAFVGCETKLLPAPSNLVIEDGILTWKKVDNASGYLVSVNGEEYQVSSSFLELTLQNNKDYEIKVKAKGDGKYKDSEFSEVLNYSNKISQTLKRLNSPNIIEIDGLGNAYWTLVSNSMGYKIFKNNILYKTINDPYTTSLKLDIDETGTYSIQVQAIGDNVNFSDSAKSNVYKLVINPDGKPNLPTLNTPEITYNSKTESLEWNRIRNAVEYFVFLNETVVGTLPATGESDYSYQINPNLTTNVFTVVAVGDNISYGMSKKSNAITFPLVPSEPPKNLRVEVMDGAPTIIWDEVDYSRGYIIEINAKQERVLTNTFNLNQYEDGEYHIRVLANGDNLFYTSTVFCEQISVKVKDGMIEKPRLDAPDFPRYINSVLYWEEVMNAEEYEIVVETPYDDTISTLYYTTKETSLSVDSVFEDTVLIFYVRATGNGFKTSLFSKGLGYVPNATKTYVDENGFLVTIQGEQYYFAKVPTDIAYDGNVLTWSKIDEASGYVINVDNQQFTSETNSLEVTLNGSSVISVMTLTEKDKYYTSPKSVETLIISPKRLKTPLITLNKTLLTWESINGASEYMLFANGEQFNIAGNYIDLKTILKIDGVYTLSVVALSGDNKGCVDSLKSNELSFKVDYGEYGTIEKPYLITTYDDFALLVEHPDAYFRIDVAELDLENEAILPLFDENIFTGNLNGNNAVIKNFRVNSTNLASGFFGTLGSCEIYNLTFENVTVLNGVNVGVISHSASGTKLENIAVRNSNIILSKNANTVGGLFGTFKGTAKNVSVDIRIVKSDIDYSTSPLGYVGGFAGVLEGEIEKITLSGTLEIPQKLYTKSGFLSGELKGRVDGLKATNIKLISGGQYNGLISGYAEADLFNVNVSGVLESLDGYNGLFGNFKGEFEGVAHVDISVSSQGTVRVGGFSGYFSDSKVNIDLVSNIIVTCDFALVGGFAGDVYGDTEYTFNNPVNISVNANRGYIGGVFGRISNDIQGSASGKIEINVNPEKNIEILVGSFKGNYPDKCLDTDVVLSGNITDYIFMKPSGDGSKDNPYCITNEEEFFFMEKEPSAYYILTNNITLTSGFFKDIAFSGYFDGNGYTLSNIYSDSSYSGLFGKTENASIRNLNLKDVYIRGNVTSGGLVGYAVNTKIENVSVEGTIINNGGISGGITGFADNSTISYCGFKGKIINISSELNQDCLLPFTLVGGVVGENKSTIDNTFSICDFDGDSDFIGGGFVGRNFGTITNSYAVGKLLTNSVLFSGFSQTNSGVIDTCYEAIDSLFDFTLFSQTNSGISNCYYISPTFINGTTLDIEGVDEIDNITAIENGIFADWNNYFGYSLIASSIQQNVAPVFNDISITLNDTLSFNILTFIDLKMISSFGVGKIDLPSGITLENGIITVKEYGTFTLPVRYRDFVMNIELNLIRNYDESFVDGDGSRNNPYLINDFNSFEQSSHYNDTFFKLISDIIILETIDTYNSNLDGNGYSLKCDKPLFNTFSGVLTNVKLESDIIDKPLIDKIENAELSNIQINASIISNDTKEYLSAIGIIENSIINGLELNISIDGNAQKIGGLSSQIEGVSRVENITLDVDIRGSATYLGGLFATSDLGIYNVSGYVKIHESTSDYIGGIVGKINNILCDIDIDIEINNSTAHNMLGGVSGQSDGNLQNCHVEIDVTNSNANIFGGVVGSGYILTDCVVEGDISVKSQGNMASLGGITGTATKVYATFKGNLSVENESASSSIGLAVGSCSSATVEACGTLNIKNSESNNTGIRMGTVGVGNVSNSTIQITLYYESLLIDTYAYFGGATGEGSAVDNDIEINIESDNIKSKLYIGGVVGNLNDKVENNIIKGKIESNDSSFVGSIAGYGYQENEELLGKNEITITIKSQHSNGEIGYIEIQENN